MSKTSIVVFVVIVILALIICNFKHNFLLI